MKNTSKDAVNPQRLITPEFRVSYPHLFKPNAIKQGDDEKYSVTMLFKKTQDLSKLKLAMDHAKIEMWGRDKTKWPKGLLSPVSDGDSEQYLDDEGVTKEGYAGHWVIKASSRASNKPGIVNEEAQPILDASEIYPGCFARAQIYANPWEYAGKKGVSFILDAVQKTKDGPSLSNRKSASEIFDPISASGDTTEEDADNGFM